MLSLMTNAIALPTLLELKLAAETKVTFAASAAITPDKVPAVTVAFVVVS